jgi:hypothetical protein
MTHAIGWGVNKLSTFHGKRKNKYGVKKVYLDGFCFDSPKEGRHYILLKHRQKAGEISALVLHPEYALIVNDKKVGRYTGDFFYVENGKMVCEDIKGFKARDWPLRSKLFMALYPEIELRVNGIKARAPKPPKAKRASRGKENGA